MKMKIKDNVDLQKILEQFGWERIEDCWNRPFIEEGKLKGEYVYIKTLNYETPSQPVTVLLEIEEKTRQIYQDCYTHLITPKKEDIQDLIQAGLVEEVSD